MKTNDPYLMIPGPVTVLPRVLKAMSQPLIPHRGKEFEEILNECVEGLKPLFGTGEDVLILSGTGTLGMEASISNFVSEEDVVLNIVNGKFGERFYEITKKYATPRLLEFEWGNSVDIEKVEEGIEGVNAITIVHNETSTGILNPVKEIAKIAHKEGALVIMDGITSVGGEYVEMDKWGVDVAVVGSQKCLGCPPGLCAVAVSERAWDKAKEVKNTPYYCDLLEYKKALEKGQTPYTPAVSLFLALRECVRIINEEGIDARVERHRRASTAVREAACALGIELFPEIVPPSKYSPTVTAMRMPNGITDSELRNGMKEYGVYVAGGQGRLKGKIFRMGTMGDFNFRNLLGAISILEGVLVSHGVIDKPGAGVGAAVEVLFG